MGDGLDQFLARDAVLQREFEMKRQLVHAVLRDQARYGHEAAVARRELRTLPHVAEQNVVGVIAERGRDVAERAFARGGGVGHGISFRGWKNGCGAGREQRHRRCLATGEFGRAHEGSFAGAMSSRTPKAVVMRTRSVLTKKTLPSPARPAISPNAGVPKPSATSRKAV